MINSYMRFSVPCRRVSNLPSKTERESQSRNYGVFVSSSVSRNSVVCARVCVCLRCIFLRLQRLCISSFCDIRRRTIDAEPRPRRGQPPPLRIRPCAVYGLAQSNPQRANSAGVDRTSHVTLATHDAL